MGPSAKIIADSISPEGHRLTTLEVTFHRFVLAEMNTHRAFSRNSASSRAIPVEKQFDRVLYEPAWPVEWASEQPGMQGGNELTGQDLKDAQALFATAHRMTLATIDEYLKRHPEKSTRLHKSLINRLMEPFMWHTAIISSTQWENFWHQRATRYSPMAQPELRASVDLMLEAYEASEPVELQLGGWHLPYVDQEDWDLLYYNHGVDGPEALGALTRVSAARCARVSYLTHDGKRDMQEDLKLYKKLTSARPMHASPLEHVATPIAPHERSWCNFRGWRQLRHSVEYWAGIDSLL